jgi:hypothetical protein
VRGVEVPRVKVPIVPVEAAASQSTVPPVVATPAPIPAVTEPVPTVEKQSFLSRFTTNQLLVSGFGVLFLFMAVMLVSLMHDKGQLETKVSKLSGSSSVAAKDEVNRLTQQIGQYYQLPTGETPTLATVSDVTKVRNQAFFKDAANGDKVLLYSKAGQAILFRPTTKKIISVAPVNLNGNAATSTTNNTTSK